MWTVDLKSIAVIIVSIAVIIALLINCINFKYTRRWTDGEGESVDD